MGITTRDLARRICTARAGARSGSVGLLALGLLTVGLTAPGTAVSLSATPVAATMTLSPGCTQPSPTSITCTFTSPGEYPVAIPSNTTAVQLTAVGGQGGYSSNLEIAGGVGASVSAPMRAADAIAAGVLYAEVGGDGASCQVGYYAAAGGANGGGASWIDSSPYAGASGGGGESDVRTVPVDTADPVWAGQCVKDSPWGFDEPQYEPSDPVGSVQSLNSRVLVAAGGGGAGVDYPGGPAGQAGYDGPENYGDGGAPGTTTGPGGDTTSPYAGGLGWGGSSELDGGGGGAGLYGGAAGLYEGGGGGGSSLAPGGTIGLASPKAAPSVTIDLTLNPCAETYTGPQSAPITSSPSGLTCIEGATVNRGIIIAAGSQILITNSTIDGGITAYRAASFTMCGSTAASVAAIDTTGPTVIGDPGQQCAPNTLSSLLASGNQGGVTIEDNTISGSWLVVNNSTPVTVTGNHH